MIRWRVGRLAVVLALALCAGSTATAHATVDAPVSSDDAPRLVHGGDFIAQAPLGHAPLVRELGRDGNTGPSGRLAARPFRHRTLRFERMAPTRAQARANAVVIAALDFSSRLALLRTGLTGWHSTAPPPSSIQS